VMVGGKWRVIDGEIVGMDIRSLISHHRKAAAALIADL
jgi:8-oxoguanine deaminase